MECRSYISGRWSELTDGPVVELHNPSDSREVVSVSRHATVAEASAATTAAVDAFARWKQVPLADRVELVVAMLRAIADWRDGFAMAIHRETGKTLREAEQEVYATGVETEVQLDIFGDGLVEQVAGHCVAHEPLGAVLLVTPSNFPLAATMRKLVPALLAGNTVVVKGSELTPVTSTMLFEVMNRVGVPEGVANLVLADGRDVIDTMLDAPGLQAVSLTGSNTAGSEIAGSIGERNIRFQAEMGGSNAAVVLQDADLGAAADAIAVHGFTCAGQWCTGTTRVIVEDAIFEEFRHAVVERIGQIRAGRDADMGAMISAAHLQNVADAVLELSAAGAQVLLGGDRADQEPHGYFFEPTVLEASPDAQFDEIFGPVIVLQRAADAADALRIANASRYGLSFSVFTQDEAAAESIVAGAEAGICHINLGTGYRDNALPVCGWNESGRGTPECGTWARDFFTRPKAIYRAG